MGLLWEAPLVLPSGSSARTVTVVVFSVFMAKPYIRGPRRTNLIRILTSAPRWGSVPAMAIPTYSARETRCDVGLGRERKMACASRARTCGLTLASYVRAVLDLAFTRFTHEEIVERADHLTRPYQRTGT